MTRPIAFADTCHAATLLHNGPAIAVEDLVEWQGMQQGTNGCDSVADSDVVSRLAALVAPNQLGQEDLFYLLAHPERLEDPAKQLPLLRVALDLPTEDPEGVCLGFHTLTPDGGGQIAYLTATPEVLDPQMPPLVFVTGLYSKAALYLANLVALAKLEGRRIIAIDLPGVGASLVHDNASAYASDNLAAVQRVIHQEIPAGGNFLLAAHSLGTGPGGTIYANQDTLPQTLGRRLVRMVLLNLVPSQAERTEGMQIDGAFTRLFVWKIFTTGGAVPPLLSEHFSQQHTEAEQQWIAHIRSKERYPTSLWATLSYFLANYHRPSLLERVGVDPTLRLVIAKDDQLIHAPIEKLCGRRGIICVEGDHDWLIGPTAKPEVVERLRQALEDPLDEREPLIDHGSLYRRLESASALTVRGDTAAQLGIQLTFGGRVGLFPWGPFGTDFAFATDTFIGGRIDDGAFALSTSARGELGIEWRNFPLRLGAGAEFTLPLDIGGDHPAIPYGALLIAALECRFEAALMFRMAYHHALTTNVPHLIPPDTILFSLGVALGQ